MKVCRICLSGSDLCQIFGTDEDVATNIMLIASVQVSEGDIFPQHICTLCKVELDICVSFKKKCELSYIISLNTTQAELEIKHEKLLHCKDYKTAENVDIYNISEDTNTESSSRSSLSSKFKPLECQQCDLQFVSLKSYNIHLEKNKHVCNICNLHFEYRNVLSRHLKSNHDIVSGPIPDKLKQCENCGKSFRYDGELLRHMTVHSGVKQFKCNKCDKKFSTKGSLIKHIVKHGDMKTFSCPICSKKFIHQSNLSAHIKVHSNEIKYKCHICTKAFKTNRTLIHHIKLHNNERNFICGECGKAFTNKFDLLRHVKLHQIKKELKHKITQETVTEKKEAREMATCDLRQCELCGKLCRSLSDLEKHIRVHTGESPFGCIYCEKSFKNSSSLNCHVRIHTQDKPHICKYCGKGFVQSSNLRTHETIHSPIKPHNCGACSQSFNRKRDLIRHKKKCIKSDVENDKREINI